MTPSIELTRPQATVAASDVVQTGQKTDPPGPAFLDRFSVKKTGQTTQQVLGSTHAILFGNTLVIIGAVAATFAIGILLGGPIGGIIVGTFWAACLVSAFADQAKAEIEFENSQKRMTMECEKDQRRMAMENENNLRLLASVLRQHRHCCPREVEWYKKNVLHT